MKDIKETLEFDKVLSFLAEFAISSAGKEKCLNAEIYEYGEKIKKELTLVDEMVKIYNKVDNTSDFPLENFADMSKIFADAISVLETEDILSVAKNLQVARLVNSFLEQYSDLYPNLANLRQFLYLNREFEKKVEKIFDKSGTIKDDATDELRNLKRSKKDTEANIKTMVSRLLSSNEFCNHLQDTIYTLRDERIVFQVKAESKNKVSGIVHDVSATGQTFFVEPKELVEINNKLKEINIKIQVEIERILRELSKEIFVFSDSLKISSNTLAQLDFILAKAKYAAKYDMCLPEIVYDRFIDIKGMKNPVLMSVKENIVENNLEIGSKYQTLIISGSNTGGKTVILKTIGLFVLMAKAGMFLPAYSAKIYPFKKIFALIGDNQNIVHSLSTFSSHMADLIEIVNAADNDTLICIDEITAGTDPKEGSAIAQILLEYFVQSKALSIITTHYSELKSMAFKSEKVQNAAVEFDSTTLLPTYKLAIGIPGASHAIEIAENLGLKKELSEKAKELYFSQEDITAKVLIEMNKTQNELSKAEEKLKSELAEIEELKKDYDKKLSELKKEKKKNLQIYKSKYESQLEKARSDIKSIMKAVREEKSEKIALRAFQKIGDIENNLSVKFRNDEDEFVQEYKPVEWDKVKIGDKLLLKGLNQEVKLLEMPDKNDDVQILMGMLKSNVKKNKLAKFDKKMTNKVKEHGFSRKNFELKKQALSQTLDLRGKRVDEAVEETENYLDKASLLNLSPVYIIHGHGTGALKQVIRDYLKTSPYPKKFYPAEQSEGGDGVTVVEI